MKNSVLTLILFFVCFQIHSQKKDAEVYIDIIQQIWKPFKKSFDNKDAKMFNALHTNDILRINKWGVKQGDTYKKGIIKSYNRTSEKTRTIEFWIEQSVFSETISHQIGYYVVTYKEPNKADKTSYAQFQVTLKKVNGAWKIWQDFDTEMVGSKKVDASFIEKLKKLEL